MKKNAFLIIDGHRIWTEQIMPSNSRANADSTLVFLHEGLGSIALWRSFPEELCKATGLPGILYDRLGYGHSDPMPEPWDRNYLHREALNYLPKILSALNISNPVLIGHSDGGTIALLFAAHHAVKAVITEAAHVYVERDGGAGIQNMVKRYQTTNLKEKLSRYHGTKTDALFYSWANTWRSEWFADWNIEAILAQITAPALLIQGADDEYASPKHLEDIARGIDSNARTLLLENCGHTPHAEAKDIVLEAMKKFIERIKIPKY